MALTVGRKLGFGDSGSPLRRWEHILKKLLSSTCEASTGDTPHKQTASLVLL